MTAHQSTGVAVIRRTTQDGYDWPTPHPVPPALLAGEHHCGICRAALPSAEAACPHGCAAQLAQMQQEMREGGEAMLAPKDWCATCTNLGFLKPMGMAAFTECPDCRRK